ncbi:polyprenyl synthetase family protein [bacterium]|nr:polyprenyl synthetase family protein [bacterium]
MNARVLNSRSENLHPGWTSPIATELDQVERIIESSIRSEVSVAFDLSMHLYSAGGKRIRPALVLLSALACNKGVDIDRVGSLAAATELVHMASLVHDDVVDETHERRGTSTANSTWGNKLSVLGGDFLLSKAFSLLGANGDVEILRTLSSMAVGMAESEMLQAQSEGSVQAWQRNYDKIIQGKTASFMRACCECGAILGGADNEQRKALTEYGMMLGHAFQITDDILDIVGDPVETGKDVGSDLVNGKFTLPVLIAWDKPEFGEVKPLLIERPLTPENAKVVARRIVECGAVDEAHASAQKCVSRACAGLSDMPESDYICALRSLAEFVIGRRV